MKTIDFWTEKLMAAKKALDELSKSKPMREMVKRRDRRLETCSKLHRGSTRRRVREKIDRDNRDIRKHSKAKAKLCQRIAFYEERIAARRSITIYDHIRRPAL